MGQVHFVSLLEWKGGSGHSEIYVYSWLRPVLSESYHIVHVYWNALFNLVRTYWYHMKWHASQHCVCVHIHVCTCIQYCAKVMEAKLSANVCRYFADLLFKFRRYFVWLNEKVLLRFAKFHLTKHELSRGLNESLPRWNESSPSVNDKSFTVRENSSTDAKRKFVPTELAFLCDLY